MDSKTEELVLTEKIPNRNGKGERIVVRASSGMFMKKPDPLSKEEIQKSILTKVSEVDDKGSSVLERILDNQIASATTPAAQPLIDKLGNAVLGSDGYPVLVTDPKVMMASAKASQVVLKAANLEQPEKEQVQQHRVEIVIITPPENLMNKAIIEDKPREALRPPASWIEGEFQEGFSNPSLGTQAMVRVMQHTETVGRTQPARKEFANVETLYRDNEAEIAKKTQGVPMSAVHAKAQSDLPLRINQRNIIVQGWYRLASAVISNQATIEVLVEQNI